MVTKAQIYETGAFKKYKGVGKWKMKKDQLVRRFWKKTTTKRRPRQSRRTINDYDLPASRYGIDNAPAKQSPRDSGRGNNKTSRSTKSNTSGSGVSLGRSTPRSSNTSNTSLRSSPPSSRRSLTSSRRSSPSSRHTFTSGYDLPPSRNSTPLSSHRSTNTIPTSLRSSTLPPTPSSTNSDARSPMLEPTRDQNAAEISAWLVRQRAQRAQELIATNRARSANFGRSAAAMGAESARSAPLIRGSHPVDVTPMLPKNSIASAKAGLNYKLVYGASPSPSPSPGVNGAPMPRLNFTRLSNSNFNRPNS